MIGRGVTFGQVCVVMKCTTLRIKSLSASLTNARLPSHVDKHTSSPPSPCPRPDHLRSAGAFDYPELQQSVRYSHCFLIQLRPDAPHPPPRPLLSGRAPPAWDCTRQRWPTHPGARVLPPPSTAHPFSVLSSPLTPPARPPLPVLSFFLTCATQTRRLYHLQNVLFASGDVRA